MPCLELVGFPAWLSSQHCVAKFCISYSKILFCKKPHPTPMLLNEVQPLTLCI